MTTTPDNPDTPVNGWLDKMIAAEPAAAEQWTDGDTFEPTGDQRDANYLYADLLAEPDTTADPYAAGGSA